MFVHVNIRKMKLGQKRRAAMPPISNESLLFHAGIYRNTKIFLSGQNIFVTLTGKQKGKALKTTAVSVVMR